MSAIILLWLVGLLRIVAYFEAPVRQRPSQPVARPTIYLER